MGQDRPALAATGARPGWQRPTSTGRPRARIPIKHAEGHEPGSRRI